MFPLYCLRQTIQCWCCHITNCSVSCALFAVRQISTLIRLGVRWPLTSIISLNTSHGITIVTQGSYLSDNNQLLVVVLVDQPVLWLMVTML